MKNAFLSSNSQMPALKSLKPAQNVFTLQPSITTGSKMTATFTRFPQHLSGIVLYGYLYFSHEAYLLRKIISSLKGKAIFMLLLYSFHLLSPSAFTLNCLFI